MTLTYDSLEHMQGERVWRFPIPPTCRKCGYNLTGLPGSICPECGRQFSWREVQRRVGRIWSNINRLQHADQDAKLGLRIQTICIAAVLLSHLLGITWVSVIIRFMAIGGAVLGIVLGAQVFNVRRIPRAARQYITGKRPSMLLGTLVVLLGFVGIAIAVAW